MLTLTTNSGISSLENIPYTAKDFSFGLENNSSQLSRERSQNLLLVLFWKKLNKI
jgi:hypothetical protein